jgi:hypothetical protein
MRVSPVDPSSAFTLFRPSLLALLARITRRLPSFTSRPRQPDLFWPLPRPLSFSRHLEEQNRAARASAERLRFCPHCPCGDRQTTGQILDLTV